MTKGLFAIFAVSLLAATPAIAADMPLKAPPLAPAPTWTGFYLGLNAGGAWADTTWIDTDPPFATDARYTASGFIGGGQVGFNYQIGRLVLGAEGEWDGAHLTGGTSCFQFPGFLPQGCNSSIDSIAMITGRAGTLWNGALLYVKAGSAWVHEKFSNPCSDCSITNGAAVSVASETRNGFVVGGGIEYAWARNWSARVEYDYISTPEQTLALTAVNEPTFTETLRENIQMVTFGVNYRFGWPETYR